MKEVVRSAMEEGAFGLATALIYAPGAYAKTDELIELSRVTAEYGGMYISHMRSEGNQLVEAVEELLTIAREANIPAEIWNGIEGARLQLLIPDELEYDLAMNIFTNFGFQMIVATPLKSVMTLEPFIGGACFVDIRDRKVSGVLMIEYDDQRQRLKLPEQAQLEAALEAPR